MVDSLCFNLEDIMSNDREYMKRYMRERYQRRKKEALKHLGGKCSVCGSRKKLEFDHKDRKTKFKRIARIWSYSEVQFWGEVAKCQLLCA